MRAFLAVAIVVLLSTVDIASAAPAPQVVMPQGTWQATCRGVMVSGSHLSAMCETKNNLWQRSSIDVNQCPSLLIANKNGALACEVVGGGGGANPASYYPPGNWQSTCKNFTMHGSVLTATCIDASGTPRTTSLNVDRCTNRLVANINGMLLCQP